MLWQRKSLCMLARPTRLHDTTRRHGGRRRTRRADALTRKNVPSMSQLQNRRDVRAAGGVDWQLHPRHRSSVLWPWPVETSDRFCLSRPAQFDPLRSLGRRPSVRTSGPGARGTRRLPRGVLHRTRFAPCPPPAWRPAPPLLAQSECGASHPRQRWQSARGASRPSRAALGWGRWR